MDKETGRSAVRKNGGESSSSLRETAKKGQMRELFSRLVR